MHLYGIILIKKSKQIKICEAFAGYGSQSLALKNSNYEISSKSVIVEWYTDAMEAYKSLHKPYNTKNTINDEIVANRIKKISDNSKDLKYPKGVSIENEVFKKDFTKFKEIIKNYNNYVDINDFKFETKFDLFTYSFPCQDLSLQGKQLGIKEGTRSGLLLVVEQKFDECYAKNKELLPTWLLLENVTSLISETHMPDLQKWIDKLASIGYQSKFFKLKASDCGSVQLRDRVFMVSCNEKSKFEKFKKNYTEINSFEYDNIRLKPKNIKHKVMNDILEPIENIKLTKQDLYLNYFNLVKTINNNYKLGKWNHQFDFEKYCKKNIQISNAEVRKIWNSKVKITIYFSKDIYFNNKKNDLDEINKYFKENKTLFHTIKVSRKIYKIDQIKSTNVYKFVKNVFDVIKVEDLQLFSKFNIDYEYNERFSNFETAKFVNCSSQSSKTLLSRDSEPFIIHTSKVRQEINPNTILNFSENLDFENKHKLKHLIYQKKYIVRYVRTIEKGLSIVLCK